MGGPDPVQGGALFSSLLNVVFHKFFRILFKDIINLINQLVDIFLELLARLDDLGIRLDVVFRLGFAFRLLLALLFFHSGTSRDSGKPWQINAPRDPM